MNRNYIENFKHILEYFIAHLEYMQNNEDGMGKGYSEYIKPLIDKKGLSKCGQGYRNNNIQKAITKWADFGISTIYINVQGQFGPKYYTKNAT